MKQHKKEMRENDTSEDSAAEAEMAQTMMSLPRKKRHFINRMGHHDRG